MNPRHIVINDASGGRGSVPSTWRSVPGSLRRRSPSPTRKASQSQSSATSGVGGSRRSATRTAFPMLQWATAGAGGRFALYVHHGDAAPEYASDLDERLRQFQKGWDEAVAPGPDRLQHKGALEGRLSVPEVNLVQRHQKSRGIGDRAASPRVALRARGSKPNGSRWC
jgi:hypothetical protein